MEKLWKIVGSIALLVLIAFSGVIGKLVGKVSVDNYNEGKAESALDEVLLKTASDLNAKLPIMVDSDTKLDNTIGLNKQFRYNYTLVNYKASDISAGQIESSLAEKIKNNVCTTKELQFFVKNGVTMMYAYYGNDGRLITVISVPASKCVGT